MTRGFYGGGLKEMVERRAVAVVSGWRGLTAVAELWDGVAVGWVWRRLMVGF